MNLRDLVLQLYAAFPVDDCMRSLEKLCLLDRFQASQGIEQAAVHVAEAAETAGLKNVKIHRFPADGKPQWWTFRSPRAWTPIAASLGVGTIPQSVQVVTSYPEQPCSLATYSKATPVDGLSKRLIPWNPSQEDRIWRDAVIVIPPVASLDKEVHQAAELGAAGIVATRGNSKFPDRVGRIELPPASDLFGFSVGYSVLQQLLDLANRGAVAQVKVCVDRTSHMPLVEGVLPGAGGDEILVTAHLCHHRPGANDNLSGVVGLLGMIQSLHIIGQTAGQPLQRPIRFVWGPEFTGMAAWLHCRAEKRLPFPAAAINLDMIGEDQQRCGGPLILERSPDRVGSCLEAISMRCLELLPLRASSYSGAVSLDTWHWNLVPFVGASDHGLFGDLSVHRPAIMFGHWPDRFNHSSDDTPDKIDPHELRRTATAAAAVAWSLAAAPQSLLPDVIQAIALWGQRTMSEVIARGCQNSHPKDTVDSSQADVVDPWSPPEIAGLLAQTHRSAIAAVDSAEAFWSAAPAGGWATLKAWLNGQHDEFAKLLPATASSLRNVEAPQSRTLIRGWPGPFNLLGLIEDAGPEDAEWIGDRLSDAAGSYAILVALALAIDNDSDRLTIVRRAARQSWLPIPLQMAYRFFDVLLAAGWAQERC